MTDIPASLADLDNDGPRRDEKGRLIVAAGNRNPVDIADEVAEHILAEERPAAAVQHGPAAVALEGGAACAARCRRLAALRGAAGDVHGAVRNGARVSRRPLLP